MPRPPAPPSPSERRRRRQAFAAIAPLLERAHAGRERELERERDARLRAAAAVLKAERLVAHRELQAVRAGGRRTTRAKRAAYVEERDRKLVEAYRELEEALERARRLGVTS